MIKKAISKFIFPILLLLCMVFTGCADSSAAKYLRVSFLAESAGYENTFNSAVNDSTSIEYQNKKDYGNTFTAYKISPHIFTAENLETVAKLFGVDEKATKLANGNLDIALYDGQEVIKWFTLSDNNMINCGFA